MSGKLMIGVVAAAAPLCAVCVLGPSAVGAMFAGAFAWIGGADPLLAGALMAAAALLVSRAGSAGREARRLRRAGDRPEPPPHTAR